MDMEKIVQINTIAEAYAFLGQGTPPHPLIAVVRQWPKLPEGLTQLRFSSDLYYLALKKEISGSFKYGRNSYDYQEGTMVFIGPGQVATFSLEGQQTLAHGGWAILFHPDLIRTYNLGETINRYSFFSYEINEALHLAKKEREFLNTMASTIEHEINQNMDRHSQELIVQNLETILKYSERYYDRQFYTRSNLNKDLVAKFEAFLQTYFSSGDLSQHGVPTIDACGEAMNMSGAYLSDLLRRETGRSAKDHIYRFLIEKAKTTLLNSQERVSQIAYQLGFEYPQNFSKLFKTKTGMSPSEYRNLN